MNVIRWNLWCWIPNKYRYAVASNPQFKEVHIMRTKIFCSIQTTFEMNELRRQGNEVSGKAAAKTRVRKKYNEMDN